MDRTAARLRDITRLGLIGAIALLLALSRTSIATANSDLVLVCHVTGSATNEIVIIRVDSSGMNGHELEELAKTYDCKPAGGGSGGTTDGGGSGGTTDGGGSGGTTDGGGSGGTTDGGGSSGGTSGGTSGGGSGGGTTGTGGSAGGGFGGTGGARIVGAAGIGPAGATGVANPVGVTLAVGGAQIVIPMTDTLVRFLARSSTGQQLGLGLTAIAGVGFLLLVLFGSLSRRRA